MEGRRTKWENKDFKVISLKVISLPIKEWCWIDDNSEQDSWFVVVKKPTGLNQSSWDLRLWSFRIQMRVLKQLSLTPIWLNFDWERNNFETIRTKRCIDELKLHLHWTVIDGFKIYEVIAIPHICHFFYTGRIFESQTFTPKNYKIHPKITTNTPKKRKYALFLHFILKNLHLTYFFTRAPPVVPVTNMRYVLL